MPKLTVLIPCKDERLHLRSCIESVRGLADEILVADSGSHDGSLEIARQLGCRVIEREYVNSADFKNWAIPQANHPWVLVVDADERVTPELATEIRKLLSDRPPHDGYELKRDLFFLGHRINHCGVGPHRLVRLFRRDRCRYQRRRVHSDVEVPGGNVGQLAGPLLHYTALDLDEFLAKQQRYSTWSALDAYEAGKRITLVKMLLHAPLRFLQLYLLRQGFRDGTAGLVVCGIIAYYSFLKDAKLWALRDCQGEETLELKTLQEQVRAAGFMSSSGGRERGAGRNFSQRPQVLYDLMQRALWPAFSMQASCQPGPPIHSSDSA